MIQSRVLNEFDLHENNAYDLQQAPKHTLSQIVLSAGYVLAEEAHKWIDQELKSNSEWSHFDRILWKGIFKKTLHVDTSKRVEDVSHLPLLYRGRLVIRCSVD